MRRVEPAADMRRELATRAVDGDREAFTELVDASIDRLYAAATLILRDGDRAQDAVQEALISAWRDVRSLRDPDAWEAWVHRLMVWACYRVARKERRRTTVELQLLPDGRSGDQSDPSASIVERDRLARHLGDLPIDQRAVLGARYRAGGPVRIAPSIHRLGNGIVNAYLIDDGGSVTIVDAGVPGYYTDIPRELETMGRAVEDVRALVLTHGHSDHIGFAERLRTERRVPVWIHEADAALARGEVPNPSKGLGPIRLAPLLGFLWFSLLRGGLRRPRVTEVATFGDGAVLDVPGSPHVVLVPGHTPGSAALHMPTLDALFVGDAIATYAVTTGRRGPQVAPFTADADQATASLGRLEGVDAGFVLPGHGEPWTGGIAEAIRLVRQG